MAVKRLQFGFGAVPSTAACVEGCAANGYRYSSVKWTSRNGFWGYRDLFSECLCSNRKPGRYGVVKGPTCDRLCTKRDFLRVKQKAGGKSKKCKGACLHANDLLWAVQNEKLKCNVPCLKGWGRYGRAKDYRDKQGKWHWGQQAANPAYKKYPPGVEYYSLEYPTEKAGCGGVNKGGWYDHNLRDERTWSVVYDSNKPTRSSTGILPFDEELGKGVKRKTACSGDSMGISCGKGKRVVIKNAFFGRHAGSRVCAAPIKAHCAGKPGNDVTQRIRKSCNGTRSCTVLVCRPSLGFRGCPGLSLYLQVTYSCAGSNRTPPKREALSPGKSFALTNLDTYGDRAVSGTLPKETYFKQFNGLKGTSGVKNKWYSRCSWPDWRCPKGFRCDSPFIY